MSKIAALQIRGQHRGVYGNRGIFISLLLLFVFFPNFKQKSLCSDPDGNGVCCFAATADWEGFVSLFSEPCLSLPAGSGGGWHVVKDVFSWREPKNISFVLNDQAALTVRHASYSGAQVTGTRNPPNIFTYRLCVSLWLRSVVVDTWKTPILKLGGRHKLHQEICGNEKEAAGRKKLVIVDLKCAYSVTS